MSLGLDIASLSQQFETKTPQAILRWAGRGETGCGLHTELFRHNDTSEVGDQFVSEVKGLN